MDDLVKNIWRAEDNQEMSAALGAAESAICGLKKQQNMNRDEYPLLPAMNTKTVDEMWSDIYQDSDTGAHITNGVEQQQQATFGEMTLEDFLVKAGVVKEQMDPGGLRFTRTQQTLEKDFKKEQTGGLLIGSGEMSFEDRDDKSGQDEQEAALSPRNFVGCFATDIMQAEALKHESLPLQETKWTSNHYRDSMAHQQRHIFQPQVVGSAAISYANAAKSIGNGMWLGQVTEAFRGLGNVGVGGGFSGRLGGPGPGLGVAVGPGLGLHLGAVSPHSSVSDEVGPGHGDVSTLSPAAYGIDGILQGRKRRWEVSTEKMVERRQRRMIKNRESAARSRARKQAYTVELEAEVIKLKEENMMLRKKQEKMAEEREQQIHDALAPWAQQIGGKVNVLRRTHTVAW